MQNCKECQDHGISKMKTTPVIPDHVAQMGVMERIAVDVFHHGGYKYLTLVDRASGYIMCRDIKSESTLCMTKALTELFNTYGYPMILRSDGAPGIRNAFDDWCKEHDISHETSSPHNFRSNGLPRLR